MDVGKKIHRDSLEKAHLLFGLVTYAKGSLGKEPIRSQGHIHRISKYGKGWSTPEIYQIWSGKAIIYMQEFAKDNPGKCYAVYAEPGDIVVVPPFWAHATISADPDIPLTFGAWCDRDYGFEYDDVRAHKGLAWYPLLDNNGGFQWHFNNHYRKSDLIEKIPGEYGMLSIEKNRCIYTQCEADQDRFLFVPEPYLVKDVWENFIP
jgi:glucose-6-phosphate isomerase